MSSLAHAGGVDEAAMIVLPLVLFGVFFALERRARRRERESSGEEPQNPDDAGTS